MDFALYFVRTFLFYLIDVILLAMIARSIFSFFDPEGENPINVFLMTVTEPLIYPIRAICAKNNWFEDSPMDIPFMITFFLFVLIQLLVEVI